MKFLYLLIPLLTGCVQLNPLPLMTAEEQAIRLLQCSSLNLDFQVKYNNYSEVVDITCKPKFGHDYQAPESFIRNNPPKLLKKPSGE